MSSHTCTSSLNGYQKSRLNEKDATEHAHLITGCTVECVGSGEELKTTLKSNMATGEGTSENSVKRRGSYLSYLSNPVKKVPRTTNYGQKQSEKNCLSFEDKRYQTIVTPVVQAMTTTLIKHAYRKIASTIVEISIKYWKKFWHRKQQKLISRTK